MRVLLAIALGEIHIKHLTENPKANSKGSRGIPFCLGPV